MHRIGLSLVMLGACTEASVMEPPNLATHARIVDPIVFNTQLRPATEVRTDLVDPVESVARGHAQIKLFPDNTVRFKITVQNPGAETFILGHIHQAPVGINGPIVVDLLGSISESGTLLKLEGTEPLSADLAAAIRADPAGFYVNLHTTADPQGAVRGQLP
jgi:hypothetical protein